MKIVSFSFGQTSGLMLRKLMDANPKTFDKDFKVVFENTGREHDKTLEFGNNVSRNWGVPIIWLEYTRTFAGTIKNEWVSKTALRHLKKAKEENKKVHWHKVVNYQTAKRIGQIGPFDELLEAMPVLPNVVARFCSKLLKNQVLISWLWRNGVFDYDDYVGIRDDEAHRAIEIIAKSPKYRRVHFVLIDNKIKKYDVDKFWDAQPFRLEIPNHEGNCDGCFLKKRWKLVQLAKNNPVQFQWWIDWQNKKKEKGQGGQWTQGKSYEGILSDAQHPEFGEYFGLQDDDIPCSCATVDSSKFEL